jgi:hypothetical protein
MAKRVAVTTDNVRPGSTVYVGKGGRIAYTVLAFESDPLDPNGQVLVIAQRPGYMETTFCLSEVTTTL